MRPFILAVCVSCATVPAAYAQMEDDPAKELFGRFLRFFVPEHAELFGKLGTPDEYEMPEVLPNGDILIRRKPKPLPPRKRARLTSNCTSPKTASSPPARSQGPFQG